MDSNNQTRFSNRTVVRMTPEMREKVEAYAEAKQMSLSILVRQALLEYFEKHEKKTLA